MSSFGIEQINVYAGCAFVDVATLATHRGLDEQRIANLMMQQKSVALPFEDPVSYAVNAARPILDAMSAAERESIRVLITCTESGIDFGKSVSTYVHQYLGLSRNCRMFEVKQACYSGTAGLQTALAMLQGAGYEGAKALVITTDISRFVIRQGELAADTEWGYAELSSGAGAVAVLLGDAPALVRFDEGASGCYSYEVMDTCRPAPDMEAGDPDLSLFSYLDCCENAFRNYSDAVDSVDFVDTFDCLAFHNPFGGMVKGAHRMMMKKFAKAAPDSIEADFQRRMLPSLRYGQRVGNILGGSLLLSLISTIEHGTRRGAERVGLFSYGSGCCSEFYSAIIAPQARQVLAPNAIAAHLEARVALDMPQYEQLLASNGLMAFGTRDLMIDQDLRPLLADAAQGKPQLMLSRISGYHRQYEWLE